MACMENLHCKRPMCAPELHSNLRVTAMAGCGASRIRVCTEEALTKNSQ